MKLAKVEELISKLRLEFPGRIEEADISITINGNFEDLRWRFDLSDVCVDRLYIWAQES